jgi:hypothetical protein
VKQNPIILTVALATTFLVFALIVVGAAQAGAVNERLAEYRRQGAAGFSAKEGEAQWFKEVADASTGKPRSCATCHGRNLSESGRHAETGKVIEPMRPAVNPKRLTDAKHIEKWFTRNCKWTYGRECTAQEKGNFLFFIHQ